MLWDIPSHSSTILFSTYLHVSGYLSLHLVFSKFIPLRLSLSQGHDGDDGGERWRIKGNFLQEEEKKEEKTFSHSREKEQSSLLMETFFNARNKWNAGLIVSGYNLGPMQMSVWGEKEGLSVFFPHWEAPLSGISVVQRSREPALSFLYLQQRDIVAAAPQLRLQNIPASSC